MYDLTKDLGLSGVLYYMNFILEQPASSIIQGIIHLKDCMYLSTISHILKVCYHTTITSKVIIPLHHGPLDSFLSPVSSSLVTTALWSKSKGLFLVCLFPCLVFYILYINVSSEICQENLFFKNTSSHSKDYYQTITFN